MGGYAAWAGGFLKRFTRIPFCSPSTETGPRFNEGPRDVHPATSPADSIQRNLTWWIMVCPQRPIKKQLTYVLEHYTNTTRTYLLLELYSTGTVPVAASRHRTQDRCDLLITVLVGLL